FKPNQPAAPARGTNLSRSARPGPLADLSGPSADRASDRQPALAATLWPGIGRYTQRFRLARLAALSSSAARLAGLRVGVARLVAQAHAPAHGPVGLLPASRPVGRSESAVGR